MSGAAGGPPPPPPPQRPPPRRPKRPRRRPRGRRPPPPARRARGPRSPSPDITTPAPAFDPARHDGSSDPADALIRRIGVIGNHLPRQCGIATFTTHLSAALADAS